ncbi:MAG: alpha/beta fold hydrolase [Actinomycetota bacterium]
MLHRQHVTIHGHDVRYVRAGEGPVILLIHGIAGSARTWREATEGLAEEHTVIAPDLIGHGESAKPIGDYSLGAHASGLRDLLGVLEIPRATVVGHSFGGGVAMQLAYQHPECCERLVLVASGGLGPEVSWMLRALALPGSELLWPIIFPSFVRDRGTEVGRALWRWGLLRSSRLEEMWRSYSSLADSPNRRAFLRTLRSVVDTRGQVVSAMDRLYLAAWMPTVIIWGDQDNIIPVAHGYAAHEAIPGSRLEIFEGADHFPHAEQPERFVEVVSDFMASTIPGGGPETYHDLLVSYRPSSDVPSNP